MTVARASADTKPIERKSYNQSQMTLLTILECSGRRPMTKLSILFREGPATVLVVLGIELDSINQAARLPADKL